MGCSSLITKLRCGTGLLLAASLLISCLSSSAGAAEQVGIAMILYRGETSAEKGFRDALVREKQYDIRYTVLDAEQSKQKLEEIVRNLDPSKYRLIYAFGTTVTQALMKKTRTTPIVFNIVQRPVEAGIVKSWESSGNNVTGASNYVAMENAFQTLGMVMHIHKLGYMYYVKDPSTGVQQKQDIAAQQRKFGFSIIDLPVMSKETIPQTLKNVLDTKPDAVMIPADSFIKANAREIVSTLNKHKIPTIVIIPEMVRENGAFLALGPDYYTLGQLAAGNAVEILKGKKPAEISIKRVGHLNLVINQRTADKLGVNIPLQLLRLSEVIK